MAPTDQHGGGITLSRTFGRDLPDFDLLFCVADQHDIAERFKSRTRRWLPFFRTAPSRKLLGCRLSDWCARHPFFETLHARACAHRIHRLLPVSAHPTTALVAPQSTVSLRTLQVLRRLRPVSYGTWIMDDNWARLDTVSGVWSYSPSVTRLLRPHLQQAEIVITISDTMGRHFKNLFQVNYEVLFAPSPFPVTTRQPRTPWSPSKRIAYFGTLSLWPADALARLVPHLSRAGYELDLFSHNTLPSSLAHPYVRTMPPLSPDVVRSAMEAYDAVLLPIGFTPATASYTHFNIATKMAECLGSGTLTFAFGPPHAAMMQYLEQHACALRVSSCDSNIIASAFDLLQSPTFRHQQISHDLTHAMQSLNPEIIQARWHTIRDRIRSSDPCSTRSRTPR